MNKGRSGISRVEVILVLVIIVVFAAVALAAVSGWVGNSKQTECLNDAFKLRRSYAAGAAYHEYEVSEDDLLTVLGWAADDADVKTKSATEYTSPCGGDCDITYSEDNNSIDKIVCSKHGVLFDFSGDAKLAAALFAAIDAVSDKSAYGENLVSSTVPTALRDAVLANLGDAEKAALEKKSWFAVSGAGPGFDKSAVYLYDGNISSLPLDAPVVASAFGSDGERLADRELCVAITSAGGERYKTLSEKQ